MTGPTHKAMDVTLVAGIAAAASLPLRTAVPAALLAYGLARAPDLVEGPLGLDHREQSHWPLVGIVLALLAGVLAVVATGYVDDAGAAVNVSEAQRDVLLSFAEFLPLAVMLGVFCGWTGHVLADALTVSGVPLYGPFDLRNRHLLPRHLLIRTYHIRRDFLGRVIVYKRGKRKGQPRKFPSRGDLAYRYGSTVATAAIVVTAYGSSLVSP